MFSRLLLAAAVVVPLTVPTAVRAEPHIKMSDVRELADLTSGGKLHKVVEFEFGKRRIYSKTREELAQIAQACRAHPNTKIVVEGHALARDEEQSIAFGQSRADLVRSLLIRYGASPSQVTAVDASRIGEPGRYVDIIVESR